MPDFGLSAFRMGVLACAWIAIAGCSPRQMIVRNLADELALQGQSAEPDLDLARDASAFYLKLSESVLGQAPEHRQLAEAVSAGFTQYAYAFVAFEADQVEDRDAKAAERLRVRAAKLYKRAHVHALNALEREIPEFRACLKADDKSVWPRLSSGQVGLAYWAAASWGGQISLSKDDPDVVADLPLAIRLAELAWKADPLWGAGALTGLMGTFEASRPGGSGHRAFGVLRSGDRTRKRSQRRRAGSQGGKLCAAGRRSRIV